MQKLLVMQSLWAMHRDPPDGVEHTLEESVVQIVEAGFDGISMSFEYAPKARRVAALAGWHQSRFRSPALSAE